MYSLRRSHIAAFLLASSAALGLAPAAHAQGMPGHGMHGGGPMMMLRGLDLTDAQRDQVFKIYHDQQPAMHQQMKQVHATREALMKLAAADNFDQAQASQAADAHAKALSTLAMMQAQAFHQVRGILTPDQRARLDQRAQKHGQE